MVQQYHLGEHYPPVNSCYMSKNTSWVHFAACTLGLTAGLGANILLAYFHYCNKGLYPFSAECKQSDLQNLAELDQKTMSHVEWAKGYVEEHSESSQHFSPPNSSRTLLWISSWLWETERTCDNAED